MVFYDGWIMRFGRGYTWRANSIVPLYPSTRQAAEKFQHCESLFGAKGLPTAFKLVSADQPEALDDALAARGYQPETGSEVQLLDLQAWQRAPGPDATVAETLTSGWFEAHWRMNGRDQKQEATARQLLASIVVPNAFASVQHDGNTVACGLGVLQDGYLGLFGIVTDERLRGKGLGRRVVQALLNWGKGLGAHTAYLQVTSENAPAQALYAAQGFRALYRYWYRVRT
jgi:ribosomal protein S18 acetylase RimI-like enzyme